MSALAATSTGSTPSSISAHSSSSSQRNQNPELSVVVTTLMKGVIYRESNEKNWAAVLNNRAQVRDFTAVLGLEVIIDESEGYAFLRSIPVDEDDPSPLPRLVARRALSFPVSLLLALLRKKLAEFDSSSDGSRLIISRDQIVEMMRLFLPENGTETRLVDQIDSQISKVCELGFLRRLNSDEQQYEVRRILKAFVDGQWLSDFDQKLAGYAREVGAAVEGGDA